MYTEPNQEGVRLAYSVPLCRKHYEKMFFLLHVLGREVEDEAEEQPRRVDHGLDVSKP